MLLTAVDWFYVLLVSVCRGSLLFLFTDKRSLPLIYLILGGFFFKLITISVSSFFVPVNEWHYLAETAVDVMLYFLFRKKINASFTRALTDFRLVPGYFKILIGSFLLLALMQSSVRPFILDNETYYIQTIKWLNEYGTIKGLGNLHPFLCQNSGWHYLQSGFNFGFWSDRLNVLNGFLFAGISIFCLINLHDAIKERKGNIPVFFAGLLPLTSLLLLRFVDSPSPDLPILLISLIIIRLFLIHFNNPDPFITVSLVFLATFVCLVKITAFPVILFPAIFLIKNFRKKGILIFCITGIAGFAVFAMRNYFISGYPLYPLDLWSELLKPDWRLPEILYPGTASSGYHLDTSELSQNPGIGVKMYSWLTGGNMIDMIFNYSTLLLLAVFPVMFYGKKAMMTVYAVLALNFILLLFTSPQYRFFMHITLGLALIVIASLLCRLKKYIPVLTAGVALISFVLLLHPAEFGSLTDNPYMTTSSRFKGEYIVLPHKNSGSDHKCVKQEIGNLIYFSPHSHERELFFWITGDCPLPCVNRDQLEFFKSKYNVVPQLRGKTPREGFKSVEADEDRRSEIGDL